MMGWFKRARGVREGVSQNDYYPEPHWISNSTKLRLWFWYRFLLGRPMDGKRWTNSTFWRAASSGEDHRWLRLPGWKRALIRVSVAYVLLLLTPVAMLTYAMSGERAVSNVLTLVGAHVLTVAVLTLPVLIYRLIRAHGLIIPWVESITTVSTPAPLALTASAHAPGDERADERAIEGEVVEQMSTRRKLTTLRVIEGSKGWERERVVPLARTAAARFGIPFHPATAGRWVSVPRNYREPGAPPVEILLPGSFVMNDAARRAAVKALAERIGMSDASAQWQMEGNAPRLLLTAPELPPTHVSYADLLPHLKAAPEYTFVLGMTGKQAMSVSLKEDSPHLALSAGSGGGKSELMKSLIAQALHHGWFVLIFDVKGESQEWCEGQRGVRYIRSVGGIHDALVSIGEEIDWRTEHRSPEEKAKRVKTMVVCEEWNATVPQLQAYWESLYNTAEPEEKRTMSRKSPALLAAMRLTFTGRSLGFCQMIVAIRFSARVTNGNADIRESFGVVLMTRWKPQSIKMLAPDIRPVPKKLIEPGQWLAVIGDDAVRAQAGLFTDDEAREWATGGTTPPASPWSERYSGGGGGVATGQRTYIATTQQEFATPGVATGSDTPSLMPSLKLKKLSDMVDTLEYLGVTYKTLQHWRDNDAGFPAMRGGTPNGGYLYDLKEVTEYARIKRAAQKAERAK